MRKYVLAIVLVLTLLATVVLPASAVTGNFVPDNEHPFVGLAVFYDANGVFMHRCTGSLLSPLVFLTAGHCTDGATTARVYFQQDAGAAWDATLNYDPITGYPTTCAGNTLGTLCATSDELFNYGFADFAGYPNNHDAGLMILDQPIALPEYGSLAAAGALNPLLTERGLQDTTFGISGYGLSLSNPQHTESYRSRLMAQVQLVNLNNSHTRGFNVQLSSNPGDGRGGTCFGDSGGPIFYPADSNVIVGVNSFVLNNGCRGVNFAYRTDTADVIAWILSFVPAGETVQVVG
jgi:secreted trypsin-like serine protease